MAGDPEHGGVGVLDRGHGMVFVDWAVARDGAHGSRDLELSQSSCSKLDQVVQASSRIAARLARRPVSERQRGYAGQKRIHARKHPDAVLSHHITLLFVRSDPIRLTAGSFPRVFCKQGAAKHSRSCQVGLWGLAPGCRLTKLRGKGPGHLLAMLPWWRAVLGGLFCFFSSTTCTDHMQFFFWSFPSYGAADAVLVQISVTSVWH